MSPAPLANQSLLVDADDTLWENHALFLEAHDRFLDLMELRGHARALAKSVLDAVELHRTEIDGYGSARFASSMVAAAQRLEDRIPHTLERRLRALGRWIFEHPIDPFPGVAETLHHLSRRHHLVLVTKGQHDEQHSKIERSGLAPYFEGVEILPEKCATAFREVLQRRSLDPTRTWMIGNSPRSDINPSVAAGLRAVYIPHHTLWEHEEAPLERPPTLQLRRFTELTIHF